MVRFANAQRQLPEFWVMRRGSVTIRDTMRQYKFKDEQTAERFLNNLVRERRLVCSEEDGVMRWSRRL